MEKSVRLNPDAKPFIPFHMLNNCNDGDQSDNDANAQYSSSNLSLYGTDDEEVPSDFFQTMPLIVQGVADVRGALAGHRGRGRNGRRGRGNGSGGGGRGGRGENNNNNKASVGAAAPYSMAVGLPTFLSPSFYGGMYPSMPTMLPTATLPSMPLFSRGYPVYDGAMTAGRMFGRGRGRARARSQSNNMLREASMNEGADGDVAYNNMDGDSYNAV